MATPTENARFLQEIFAAPQASFGRMNAGRLAIAEQQRNERLRAQEILAEQQFRQQQIAEQQRARQAEILSEQNFRREIATMGEREASARLAAAEAKADAARLTELRKQARLVHGKYTKDGGLMKLPELTNMNEEEISQFIGEMQLEAAKMEREAVAGDLAESMRQLVEIEDSIQSEATQRANEERDAAILREVSFDGALQKQYNRRVAENEKAVDAADSPIQILNAIANMENEELRAAVGSVLSIANDAAKTTFSEAMQSKSAESRRREARLALEISQKAAANVPSALMRARALFNNPMATTQAEAASNSDGAGASIETETEEAPNFGRKILNALEASGTLTAPPPNPATAKTGATARTPDPMAGVGEIGGLVGMFQNRKKLGDRAGELIDRGFVGARDLGIRALREVDKAMSIPTSLALIGQMPEGGGFEPAIRAGLNLLTPDNLRFGQQPNPPISNSESPADNEALRYFRQRALQQSRFRDEFNRQLMQRNSTNEVAPAFMRRNTPSLIDSRFSPPLLGFTP